MQTLQVIKTIGWIVSVVDDDARDLLLEGEVFRSRQPDESDVRRRALRAAVNLARSSDAIKANARAVAVLEGFGLHRMIDREFLQDLAAMLAGVFEKGDSGRQLVYSALAEPWGVMVKSVRCWQVLTMPDVLVQPEKSEDVLTLRIGGKDLPELPVALLSEATAKIQTLYVAVAEAYGIKKAGELSLIKVESGSDIRVDCRGLGDVVRYLKEFFIEAWHKIRHKRSEEVIENNRAVLSTIGLIQHIQAAETKGSLDHEDATRLRLTILDATFRLFERGVLIDEIPQQETVNNQDLLVGGFAQKLLPAPKKKREAKPRAKSKRKKKPKGKDEQPEETEGALEEPPQ